MAALVPADDAAPGLPPGSRDDDPSSGSEGEAAILALRTSAGLSVAALDAKPLGPALAWAVESGLLERTTSDRLVLTLSGRLLSNEVFVRLL
jgi:coproporphyrinogen III oxidase-like Fe-S oxidoreductase